LRCYGANDRNDIRWESDGDDIANHDLSSHFKFYVPLS
jgi:hypothetical protein